MLLSPPCSAKRRRTHGGAATEEPSESAMKKHGHEEEHTDLLLPGLPDHLAQLCLSLVPPTLLAAVSRRWRRLLYTPSFPPFLALYALLESDPLTPSTQHSLGLSCYDPISRRWSELPPPPADVSSSLRSLLLRHPSFIARPIPVQSVAAGDHLVVVAGSTKNLRPALRRPIAFDPRSRKWCLGPKFHRPRRWCAAGGADGAVFISGGVSNSYSSDVAKSACLWDPMSSKPAWRPAAQLKEGHRFSREPVEAVHSAGRVCITSSAKDGAIYEIGADRWVEMPAHLQSGWSGQATSDGGGAIYVVDEMRGELKEFEWERDTWTVVMRSERLKGTVRLAAGGGKVCAAVNGGASVLVVDVGSTRRRGKTWEVEPPEGKKVIGLHVLPRTSVDE